MSKEKLPESLQPLEGEVMLLGAEDAARQRELAQIDGQYLLEGEVYNRERLEAEIAMHGQIIGEQFYHIGRKLLLLKEHEGHGYFGEALLRLGLEKRTAQKWMRAALAIGKLKSEHYSHLTQQKALELSLLSDEELEALGEGKTVAGLVLDELDKMSYSELKKQVRGHNQEKAELKTNFQKLIEEKNKVISKLEKEVVSNSKPSPVRLAQNELKLLQHDAEGAMVEVKQAFRGLRKALDRLTEIPKLPLQDFLQGKAELLELFSLVGEEMELTVEHLNDLIPPRELEEGEE